MNALFKLAPMAALASMLFVTACEKTQDAVAPSIEAAENSANAVYSAHTTGAYSVQLTGYTVGTTSTTFTYVLQRTGPAMGNGLSHWIVQLPTCNGIVPKVTAATIDGNDAGSKLAYSEGNGTGCGVDASMNILKFDNLSLDDNIAHTYTFTLSGVYTVSTGSFWVKYGNNCAVDATMETPGCQEQTIGCSLSMGYWFAKPGVEWLSSVTIGGKTLTQANGLAIWNTSNKGGMKDVKMAILQYSAIRLSEANDPKLLLSIPKDLQDDLTIIDNYFASLSGTSITTSNLVANSAATAAAGAAGGRIGTWISSNHCD